MKTLLAVILLCVGCASAPPTEPTVPVCPELPKVTTTIPACSDELMLMSEEDLKAGVKCPSTSRLTFPSYFGNNGKVLVLCQCK